MRFLASRHMLLCEFVSERLEILEVRAILSHLVHGAQFFSVFIW